MSHRNKTWQMVWRGFSLIVMAAMLVGASVGSTVPTQAATINFAAKPAPIDPDVYIALEKNGKADVLVILEQQADLSGAEAIQTKRLKGDYVHQALTSVAERTQGGLKAFLNSKGVNYRAYWIQNMIRVTVDLSLAGEIAHIPGIKYIEYYHEPYLDVIGHDLGPAYGREYGPLEVKETATNTVRELAGWKESTVVDPEAIEWNISRVNADDVWGIGINGTGAVVGDLDSGVQWDHPALINQYRPQIAGAPTRHDYNWFDGLTGSATPVDYDGHGTHTMGTIAGDDGGSNQIGMAPGAKWIACAGIGSPYVDPFGCFEFFMAPTKLDGSDPRPDLAPHVISNSWSSAGTDFHGAIQALRAAGIFFSKSAGNTGPACSTITNPGQWPEVTAAAAFSISDTIASFSSRGPIYMDYEAIMKPDLAAPGVNVRSSYPDNTYVQMSGTSMACPHVTGAVALLISANPELAGQIDILQMLLKKSAQPMIDGQCLPFVDHPNDVWGWGILNVQDAVQAALEVDLGGIAGTVYDSVTSDPIADVHITYTNTDLAWPFSDLSGNDGSFGATLVAGNYDLSAALYGYVPGSVSGVEVEDGAVTEQDIYLEPAGIYTVSGVVTETGTDDPLLATIEFVGSPVTVTTDPATGAYSAEIAEGTYWMVVTSAGHARQEVQVTVSSDLTLNYSLEPIDNYYMRGAECQPVFKWMDATNADSVSLTDDAYVAVNFPSGYYFDFYGVQYTRLYIGSNGLVTFGKGDTKWSGPIPDPATPNNGIYAFSDDLNPEAGGGIYYATLEGRYFVVEWYQIEHYPSGNPETFEIILDFDTNEIKIQYLEISNSANALAGVENEDGTEATQYAYADTSLIADNMAVSFHPAFGTPPYDVGLSTLNGHVSSTNGSVPIPGSWVYALSGDTGDIRAFLTDEAGDYTAGLCTDDYTLWADKAGYEPSAEVLLRIEKDNTYTQNFELKPIPGFFYTPEMLDVTIDGVATYDAAIHFGNTGSGEISYVIQEDPAVSWLSVSPLIGVVKPDEDEVVTVTFDSTGLALGTYTTTLNVKTSDPEFLDFNIPVTLTVECNPITNLAFSFIPTAPDAGDIITFTGEADGGVPVAFDWEFGDGATDEGEVVTHAYAEDGLYTVVLTGTNVCSIVPVVVTGIVEVGGLCEPVHDVDFTWLPTEPFTGEAVSFEATGLGDLPITYEWDFGDGSTATGELVEHTYAVAGSYDVTVTATNCDGATQVVVKTIVILSAVCDPVHEVDFTWSPTEPVEDQLVSFVASSAGTLPITYDWDFGDGSIATGAEVTHSFADAGVYPVILTATNCDSATETQEYLVTVSPSVPEPPYSLFLTIVWKN